MTRGVLLFAFNSPDYDYVKMAEFTARRAKHFLNLPSTLVTDKNSLLTNIYIKEGNAVKTIDDNVFEKVIVVDSDATNNFQGRVWLNKGRYQAYDLSPYDETLLLDVDYIINSDTLLKVFEVMDDFVCHENITYLMNEYGKKEFFNPKLSIASLWATVVGFKKTNRVKQIFESLRMVQENYNHYGHLHKFSTDMYRNDYGLTIGWKIANGHYHVKSDIIPWNLTHIGPKTYVYKNTSHYFNTEYTIVFDKWLKGKIKKEYITIKDMDFHIINKDIVMDLIQ
jgi:hypothetical protein